MASALAKKLLIKPGHRVAVLNPPKAFKSNLSLITDGAELVAQPKGEVDTLLVFAPSASTLAKTASKLAKLAGDNTILWIAYPKKSSGIKTDISRDSGWDSITSMGWEGVALVSIDDTWSAMRFHPALKVKRTSTRTHAARAKTSSTEKTAMSAQVGDAALQSKTGKTWGEWFSLLDKAKSHEKSHKEIAAYLYGVLHVPGWWCQMITVGYEQARGLRTKHQRPDGFEISVSKTIDVSDKAAFDAWHSDKLRLQFLAEPVTVRKATPHKSIRFNWPDGAIIEVRFYPKGADKCQVVVQHPKLKSARAAEVQKKAWADRLDLLKSRLER